MPISPTNVNMTIRRKRGPPFRHSIMASKLYLCVLDKRPIASQISGPDCKREVSEWSKAPCSTSAATQRHGWKSIRWVYYRAKNTQGETDITAILESRLCLLLLTALICSVMAEHALAENTLTEKEKQQGWQLLFDGNDMSQWRNFKQEALNPQWVVEDDAMKLTGGGGGDILTHKTFRNFDLRLEWNISEGGNSGIFILVDEKGERIYSHAPEIQIIDNEKHPDAETDSHRSGSLYDMVVSHPSSHKPAGEWNKVRIRFVDGFLQVWQNRVQTVAITIGDSTWNTLLKNSKFGDGSGTGFEGFAESTSGHIGLQDHGDPVEFRNLMIRELD